MSTDHLRGLERAYAAAPVTRWMGTSARLGARSATVTAEIREEFHHAGGAVHGSLYFRLLDDAAFFAAQSDVTDTLLVTTGFQLHFLRPVTDGALRAEGVLVHGSRRLLVADARLVDGDGRELARGTGTFMPGSVPMADVPGYRP